MKHVFTMGLFCNILAMGMFIYDNNAGWITWVNLFGVAGFGFWLKEAY